MIYLKAWTLIAVKWENKQGKEIFKKKKNCKHLDRRGRKIVRKWLKLKSNALVRQASICLDMTVHCTKCLIVKHPSVISYRVHKKTNWVTQLLSEELVTQVSYHHEGFHISIILDSGGDCLWQM